MTAVVSFASVALSLVCAAGCVQLVWFFRLAHNGDTFLAFRRFFTGLCAIFALLVVLDVILIVWPGVGPWFIIVRRLVPVSLFAALIWRLAFRVRVM